MQLYFYHTTLIEGKDRMGRKGSQRPTFTMYVTPGPEILSAEWSHALEALFTTLLGFQLSPPRCISSSLPFFPVLMPTESCCTHGGPVAEWQRVSLGAAVALVELAKPEPLLPCSLDTARSLTAEGRLLMPIRLPVLANFRLETLLMRVQRVVPPSSGSAWSASAGEGQGGSAEGVGLAETLGFMERLWRRSSTDVTDSFLKRLYLVRWSMPFYLPAYKRTGRCDAKLIIPSFSIANAL